MDAYCRVAFNACSGNEEVKQMVMRLLKGDGKKKDRSEDPILRRVREDGIFGQDINNMKSVPVPKPAAAPVSAPIQQLPQDQRKAIIDAAEAVFESVNIKTRGWGSSKFFIENSLSELQKLSDALKVLEKHGNAKSAFYLSNYLGTNILCYKVPKALNPWSQSNKVIDAQRRIRRNITQAVEDIALREPNELLTLLINYSAPKIPVLLYMVYATVDDHFITFKGCQDYPDFAKKLLGDCSNIGNMDPIIQEIHIRLQKKIAGVE